MKDNLPWFSHDSDARKHPKMKALVTQYGAAGYGWFWMLNEAIAGSPEAKLDLSRRVNRLALAQDMGLSGEKLDEFIAFLSDPDIDLVTNSGGILTTDRTREDHGRIVKKRQKDREDYQNKNSASGMLFPLAETPIPLAENIHSRVENSRVDKSSGGRSEYSDHGTKKIPPPEIPPGNPTLPPPPDLTKKIQTLSFRAGYSIDDNLASRLAGTLNSSWFEEPYSYLEFTAWFVRQEYPDKPRKELRDIYRKALWAWDNLREEYPAWRETQVTAALNKKADRDRKNPPLLCPHCKTAMVRGKCPGCNGIYSWDEAQSAHVFFPGFDPSKLHRPWKSTPKEVPKIPVSDFEF
jgi:hypothetical protein